MHAAEMGPSNHNSEDDSRPFIDLSHNWKQHREKYSELLMDSMMVWIQNEKIKANYQLSNINMPVVLPEQLNVQQKLAYRITQHHLQNKNQLLLLIIGTAGTGKSSTINAISRLLNSKLKRCAPTGKAAFLIAGETCHQLFHLTVNDKSEADKYKPLENNQLKTLQEKFTGKIKIIKKKYTNQIKL